MAEEIAGVCSAGAGSVVSLLAVCLVLHLLPRLGAPGKRTSDWLCVAPGIDLVLFIFTVVPPAAGWIVRGWPGFLGAVLGQYAALLVWTAAHELTNLGTRGGPRLYRVHHRMFGFVRNLSALLATTLAVPLFIHVRLAQLLVYPLLSLLVELPRYNAREWVSVSRHKFSGLVGHDLVWCLYCDWMTGVWSLASEMLRNVESFWCPIRFLDAAKCDNCKQDFPDVASGWVDAAGNVGDAVRVLEARYERANPGSNAWYGHPVRLKVLR